MRATSHRWERGDEFAGRVAAGVILAAMLAIPATAQGAGWKPIADAQSLREFTSGLRVERRLPNGELTRGEYRVDGTGTVRAWGAETPRSWPIQGNDRLCTAADHESVCYRLERSESDPGLLLAYGVITLLPTATNDRGSDRWTLGPELLIGKITKHYAAGLFPSHQWDVGGPGNRDISLTTVQPFFTCLPGGGGSVGTGPSISYDWEAEQRTVSLQVNAGKTVVLAAGRGSSRWS